MRRKPYADLPEEKKEQSRARAREYSKSHREELNEWAKRYRKENPEWARATQKRAREKLKKTAPERLLWMETRKRALKRGIPFDITPEDLQFPKFCPILGIELKPGKGRAQDSSPSLDRLVPKLGYIKGNCFIISHKANRMKQENTLEDFEKITAYIKERLK